MNYEPLKQIKTVSTGDKVCQWPTCSSYATNGTLCFMHHRIYGSTSIEEEPKKAIPQKSAKGKITDKEYKAIVKEMLAENNQCELKIKGVCSGTAQGLHHKKKRSKHTLADRSNLMRACQNCNSWIELHPLEAIEMGMSLSKHR